MPSTFGCGQEASLAPGRRPPPNSSIYDIFTNPHADNCRPLQPSVAWTSVTSLHRSRSAPANRSDDDHFETISGNDRSKHSIHKQGKRYSPRVRVKVDKHSSTRRWISSSPINCIYGETQVLFGKTKEFVSSCEGDWLKFDGDPSFHQIFGPSLQFRGSSHNQSSIDLEDLMMLDADVDAIPTTHFKDTDSRGNRAKTSSQSADIYRDGDGARNYSRERSKQKHRYAESNSDIARSVDTEKHSTKRDLEAKGDEVQRSACRRQGAPARHAHFKADCEYVVVRDGEHSVDTDFPRMRGGGGGGYQQNSNKQESMTKANLEDVMRKSSADEKSHTTSKHKTRPDRSPTRRVRIRHVRKQYDPEPAKMEPLDEVDDVETGMSYPPTQNESQESRETCLPQQMKLQQQQELWMTSSSKERKEVKNNKEQQRTTKGISDIPFAELSQEWMRFRIAEESGDWVASEEEEEDDVADDVPPMLRFMKFLSVQYATRAPENASGSKSHVDLTSHRPTTSQGHDEPQRPASAYACPERMYGGAAHYPSSSDALPPQPMHNFNMTASISAAAQNKVFPTQGKSARGKKDSVPLWEHLSPAMQVEHAAVITNQLCRAMALQAAAQQQQQQQQRSGGGGGGAQEQRKSPSSESRVSRSTEHHAPVVVATAATTAAPARSKDSGAAAGGGARRSPSEESDREDRGGRRGGRQDRNTAQRHHHHRDRNRSRFRNYSKARRPDERLDRVWFDNEIPKVSGVGAGAGAAGVTPLRGGGGVSGSPCGRPCCPSASRAGEGIERQLLSERGTGGSGGGGGGGGGGRGGRGTCACTCRDGVPIAVFNFTECAATFQQYMRSGDACADDDMCECE